MREHLLEYRNVICNPWCIRPVRLVYPLLPDYTTSSKSTTMKGDDYLYRHSRKDSDKDRKVILTVLGIDLLGLLIAIYLSFNHII